MSHRIVYVGGLTSDQSLPGAVRTHTAGILRALDESPEVELVGVFASYGLPAYMPAQAHVLTAAPPRTAGGKIATALRYARFANRVIRRVRPRFVYCRFDPSLSPLIRSAGSGVITEYNDVFLDQIEFALRRGHWGRIASAIRASAAYRKAIEHIEERVFRSSRLVVCVTEGIAQHCARVAPSSNRLVLPNASNAQPSPRGSAPAVDGSEPLRISHVGTLTYWDGLEELLEALAVARQRCEGFRFVLNIVGTGSLRPTLEAQVVRLGLSENVVFSPPVAHPEALVVLEGTDVVPLLKTIASYGLSPIKYYEALAMGCIVVASDIPHINEGPGFAVRVVAYPLVVEEIADVLLRLHEDRAGIRALRPEIVRYARTHHTWRARVETLLGALRGSSEEAVPAVRP